MATATAVIRSPSEEVSSAAAIVGTERTGDIRNVYYNVYQGVEITLDKPNATAVVKRAFLIECTPTEDGYMASSRISTAFELGSTHRVAAINYLRFLADEILWLQKNADQLSSPMQEDFRRLQYYLQTV